MILITRVFAMLQRKEWTTKDFFTKAWKVSKISPSKGTLASTGKL